MATVLSNRIGPDLPELDEIGPDDHLFREVTRHDEGVRDRHALQLEEETDHLVRGESPLSVAQLKRPRGRRSQQPSDSAGDVAADQRLRGAGIEEGLDGAELPGRREYESSS